MTWGTVVTVFRRVAVGVVAAGVLAVGAGGSAAADAVSVPDRWRTVTTDAGYQVVTGVTETELIQIPPLTGAPTTREGLLSSKAVARIEGAGRELASAGTVSFVLEFGCQIDVSSGVTLGITPSVGVSVSASGPGVNAGLSGTVGPIFSTTIKPGQIV
ncbi:MspA family porin, partial [Rhodococcus tibetensis]